MSRRWRKVVFAADLEECEDCGEPWCKKHQQHYWECECLGPTEDDVEYQERGGVLWARRMKSGSGSSSTPSE